jgi:hypothetical protein
VDDLGIFIVGIVIFAVTVVGSVIAGSRTMQAAVDNQGRLNPASRPEE